MKGLLGELKPKGVLWSSEVGVGDFTKPEITTFGKWNLPPTKVKSIRIYARNFWNEQLSLKRHPRPFNSKPKTFQADNSWKGTHLEECVFRALESEKGNDAH